MSLRMRVVAFAPTLYALRSSSDVHGPRCGHPGSLGISGKTVGNEHVSRRVADSIASSLRMIGCCALSVSIQSCC